jgi:flagella basal body P-ring formation protein FlgA
VAVVTSEHVTLDDIGQVSHAQPLLAASLRAVQIGAAPAAGASAVVALSDVQDAIVKAGINPTSVLVSGASRCQVTRPARPDAPQAPSRPARAAASRPAADTEPAMSDDASGKAVPTSRPAHVPAKGSLEEAVVQHLMAKLADLDGKPEIRFSAAAGRVLSLGAPTYQFRVRDRGDDCLGLVALEADVIEGGKVADTVPIVADVALVKTVAVARSPINRGELIKAKHLMLAERRFTRLSSTGVSDLQSLVGQEAARFLDRGVMLSPRDVRSRPLVARGDIVTVWVRQGGLVIKSAAKALHPGTYGEVIDVKDESSGQTYSVKVTGPDTAEMNSSPPADGTASEGRQG